MIYVSLPLSYIANERHYLDLLVQYDDEFPRLGLELGVDARAIDTLPPAWHDEILHILRDAGIPVSVHLPFFELSPGSPDPFVLEATRRRLESAVDLCRLYRPAHMVGHPSYHAEIWGGDTQGWVRNCAETWSAFLALWPDHPPLYLENTFEKDPAPLTALMTELLVHENVACGVCFDVGHWHSFARGAAKQDLERWIQALRPWIRHLHLHDNDGTGDQHIGFGTGAIDFALLSALLERHGCAPTATMEPHTEEAFRQSIAYMREHRDLFIP